MPSSTSTPKVSSQRCGAAPRGSASPADVHSRRQDRSCADGIGCAIIALIIVGTLTRIVGRWRAIELEDPLRRRALGEDDPGGADAERVQRGQVARVAEEQLRHRQHDVVLPDVEHAAGVPVEAEQRAVRRDARTPWERRCCRS